MGPPGGARGGHVIWGKGGFFEGGRGKGGAQRRRYMGPFDDIGGGNPWGEGGSMGGNRTSRGGALGITLALYNEDVIWGKGGQLGGCRYNNMPLA